jgi:hypothetical protein
VGVVLRRRFLIPKAAILDVSVSNAPSLDFHTVEQCIKDFRDRRKVLRALGATYAQPIPQAREQKLEAVASSYTLHASGRNN